MKDLYDSRTLNSWWRKKTAGIVDYFLKYLSAIVNSGFRWYVNKYYFHTSEKSVNHKKCRMHHICASVPVASQYRHRDQVIKTNSIVKALLG